MSEGRPNFMPPHQLPWSAQARLMSAYAAECRSLVRDMTSRGLSQSRTEWDEEAKRAEREAQRFLQFRDGDAGPRLVARLSTRRPAG